MRVKLLGAIAKAHGYDYLRELVKPLLDMMAALPVPHSFILDPARAPEAEVLENQRTIKHVTQAFVQMVCDSAGIMPP